MCMQKNAPFNKCKACDKNYGQTLVEDDTDTTTTDVTTPEATQPSTARPTTQPPPPPSKTTAAAATTPDWTGICQNLCRTGEGGALCNCDLPPFF